MGLDFHIAPNKETATKSFPDFSVEGPMHKDFFESKSSFEIPPLLNRMNDFYRDANFAAAELPSLLKELDFLASKELSKSQRTFVESLIKVCRTAIELKKNIYVFCD